VRDAARAAAGEREPDARTLLRGAGRRSLRCPWETHCQQRERERGGEEPLGES